MRTASMGTTCWLQNEDTHHEISASIALAVCCSLFLNDYTVLCFYIQMLWDCLPFVEIMISNTHHSFVHLTCLLLLCFMCNNKKWKMKDGARIMVHVIHDLYSGCLWLCMYSQVLICKLCNGTPELVVFCVFIRRH